MQQFISSYGYLAILLLMTAESACIPVPSELTMPFGGAIAAGGVGGGAPHPERGGRGGRRPPQPGAGHGGRGGWQRDRRLPGLGGRPVRRRGGHGPMVAVS